MAYILSSDLPDRQSNIYEKRRREKWHEYMQYLQNIKNKLRPSTRDFALADWHYNFSDHRCPHDAWLESVTVREIASDDNIQHRSLEIFIRLLGAYHDGFIELTYRDVLSYCLDLPYRGLGREPGNQGHRDWLVDEVRFSSHGKVLHEIEWDMGGHWIIECNDIEYKWLPKDPISEDAAPSS